MIDSAVGKGAFGRLFQLWFQLPVEVDLANPRGVVRFFARLRHESVSDFSAIGVYRRAKLIVEGIFQRCNAAVSIGCILNSLNG